MFIIYENPLRKKSLVYWVKEYNKLLEVKEGEESPLFQPSPPGSVIPIIQKRVRKWKNKGYRVDVEEVDTYKYAIEEISSVQQKDLVKESGAVETTITVYQDLTILDETELACFCSAVEEGNESFFKMWMQRR